VHASAGTSKLTFRNLPVDFDGHSVALRARGSRLEVVEMRGAGTTAGMVALLGTYVGRPVRVKSGDDHDASAYEAGTLVEVEDTRAMVALARGTVQVDVGRIAIVDAPAEPFLEASVSADGGDLDAELTYATQLVQSSVSYRLVRTTGTARGMLAGYATLMNSTGVDLPNATITMTADSPSLRDFAQGGAAAAKPSSDTTMVRFATPVSLGAGRTVAERLFGPSEVTLTRRVVVEGQGLPIYSGSELGETSNASVRAVQDAVAVTGGKLSPLGMLPGSTELFEGDAQPTDPPRWYGETNSRPLPGGVGLRVDLGDERQFDIRRRLTGLKSLGRCVSESSWDVSVTNPTEEPIPFEDVEPVSGDYQVLDSTLPVTANEHDYFAFGFSVEGGKTLRLRFRVRVTSCIETVGRRGYWYAGKSAKPYGKASPAK
jgi:hypothetical protein